MANLAKDLETERRKTQQCKELNSLNSKAYAKLKATNEQLKQQILLGTNPMGNVNVYHDASLPSPAAATHAGRLPFVPANNIPSRSHTASSNQTQVQQNYPSNGENFYNDSASTRSFFSTNDHSGNAQSGSGRRNNHSSSRSKERPSSDEGSQSRSHSHSHRSRPKGNQSQSTQSLVQGVGGVSLGHPHRGGGGNDGSSMVYHQTPAHAQAQAQPPFSTSSARRPSSTTANFSGQQQQSFFHQQSVQSVRGGGIASAGGFRPAGLGGRGGSN
ncbi:hypothetical protein JCM3765_004630 [Sporobolomyces pararoseus]